MTKASSNRQFPPGLPDFIRRYPMPAAACSVFVLLLGTSTAMAQNSSYDDPPDDPRFLFSCRYSKSGCPTLRSFEGWEKMVHTARALGLV
jgi:hypothetical protein